MNNQTQLNLVIGYPLGHSKSPMLHNFLYRRLNIDAVMLALAKTQIKDLVGVIKKYPVGLTCVTMPHKQSILPYLDVMDNRAKAIGAVNTVINKRDKLYGYNTDIDGIMFALSRVPIKNRTVLLLGAGGAARAVAYFVVKSGGKILYLNRTAGKANILQRRFGGKIIRKTDLGKYRFDLIINATSVGMQPNAKDSPLDKKYFRPYQTVFDVVYNAKPTKLLTEAKVAGAKTIGGMEMFIGQGVKQVELYSGRRITQNLISQVRKLMSGN